MVKYEININKYSLLILMQTRGRKQCHKKRRTQSHKGGERESVFLSLADNALNPDLQEVTRRSSLYTEPGDTPKNVFQGTRTVKSMEIERETNKKVLVLIISGFLLGGITYAISNEVIIR
jgi:hypothetical protein